MLSLKELSPPPQRRPISLDSTFPAPVRQSKMPSTCHSPETRKPCLRFKSADQMIWSQCGPETMLAAPKHHKNRLLERAEDSETPRIGFWRPNLASALSYSTCFPVAVRVLIGHFGRDHSPSSFSKKRIFTKNKLPGTSNKHPIGAPSKLRGTMPRVGSSSRKFKTWDHCVSKCRSIPVCWLSLASPFATEGMPPLMLVSSPARWE
jgi:hypothetical protein